MVEDRSEPRLEVAPPAQTASGLGMQARIAQRMFGSGKIQQLGRFRIERRLGSGGMGHVYVAVDDTLSRRVAIKLLRGSADDQSTEALYDEASALAQLSHPNVVQVHEVGRDRDRVYLVVEHIEGETLDRWAGDQSPSAVLRACIDAGRGIAAAHAAGIIHRDIKPNNIMVGKDGRVRVVDFGLARAAIDPNMTPNRAIDQTPESGVQTRTSGLRGTPAYIAPELYSGQAASPASDQFSLCVTIWQLFAGNRPFEPKALVAASEGRALAPLGRVRPVWLQRALRAGLAPEPGARWPSIDALLAELEHRGRRRGLSLAFGAVALACGALAILLDANASHPTCLSGAELFASSWSSRAQLQASLRASGWPPSQVALTLELLDDHASAWIETRDSTCAAGDAETSSLGPRDLELANACLERDQSRFELALDALIDAPLSADPRELVAELGDPRACTDSQRLALAPAPDPSVHDALEQLGRDLDRLRLKLALDPLGLDGLDDSLVLRARDLDFEPALVDALLLDAALAHELRDHERALERTREALTLAKAQGDLVAEFRCFHRQVLVHVNLLEDPERAADAAAAMRGVLGLLDEPRGMTSEALIAHARLERLEGRLGAAEHSLRAALEQDDEGLVREEAELLLANVVAEQGRHAEAIEAYRTILVRREAQLGPEHATVGTVEYNLAYSWYEQDELDKARAHIERALTIQRRAYGSASPIAPALVLRALIDAGLGNIDEALAGLDEAWPLERELAPTHTERGASLRTKGSLLVALEDFEAALAVFEEIETELQAGLSERERGMISQNIGWLSCRTGAYERARPRFETALLRDDRDIATFAQIGLAELDLVDGRPNDAAARLDEVLPQLDQLEPEVAADAIVEARFFRLRAAQDSGASRAHIDELRAQLELAASQVGMPGWIAAELEPEP